MWFTCHNGQFDVLGNELINFLRIEQRRLITMYFINEAIFEK